MKHYVLGFAFRNDCVLLILKAGRLNGVGGSVNISETAEDAMVREFEEETGVKTTTSQWSHRIKMYVKFPDTAVVDIFQTLLDVNAQAQKTTAEQPIWIRTRDVNRINFNIIDNLTWIVPLLMDRYLCKSKLIVLEEQ